MAFDPVLIGGTANDGTGDPLRTAFNRVNNNFNLAVEGPASATDDSVALFDQTSGKLLKEITKANLAADSAFTSAFAVKASEIPTGGTTGQVLAKASGTNYDTAWSPTTLVDGAARPLNASGAHLDGSGLALYGIAGNRAESPHAAVLNLTGDMDIRMQMRPRTAWNSASRAVVNKSGAYGLTHGFTSIAGDLTMRLRQSGQQNKSSTVAASANLGTTPSVAWVRATLDADNGASGHDVTFFTSTDGTNWDQLGTVVTTAGVFTNETNTNPLLVGDETGFATQFSDADIYRVQIRDGIDGTVIFDADFAAQTADALAFTESSTNTATVSITTTRYTVGIPNSGFMSIGTQAIAANTDYFEPFTLTASTVVDLLAFEVTTAPSSTATVHGAIYAATGDYQPTGAPLAVFGGVSVATSVTAVYNTQITPVTLPPGAYVLGFNSSVAFTARSMRRPDALIHTLGANSILETTTRARTNAAFPTPSAGWSVRTASSTGKNTFAVLRWRPA
jgi:hypothetical protein